MIHPKVDDTEMSLNSLQEVGRQAQAGLGLITLLHPFPDRLPTWRKHVPIPDGHLTRRLLKWPRLEDALPAVREALRSARYTRDVWIFAGRILKRGTLVRRLR